MPIYTKKGDSGKTTLFSGECVDKSDARVDAYGDVDELCAYLGFLETTFPRDWAVVVHEIRSIQSILMEGCAWLATTGESYNSRRLRPFSHEYVGELEARIDRMELELTEMKGFIIPGGHLSSAAAHVARTVCRRAERRVAGCIAHAPANSLAPSIKEISAYLNRLSDYLFVLARWCNKMNGQEDVLWNKNN